MDSYNTKVSFTLSEQMYLVLEIVFEAYNYSNYTISKIFNYDKLYDVLNSNKTFCLTLPFYLAWQAELFKRQEKGEAARFMLVID